MGTVTRIFPFGGTCNNYEWGRKGSRSLAARLCAASPETDFEIDEEKRYSEMWFGDYPNFPGRLGDGRPLGHVLREHKSELLGEQSVGKWGDQLPYLPKILSIAKALPLQVHPSKDLAAKLHTQNPEQFTDPNHKPEIAIALSHFELFAGWKELGEIAQHFSTPFLRGAMPPSAAGSSRRWTDETLREVVRALLKADADSIRAMQAELAVQLEADFKKGGAHRARHLLRVLRDLQAQCTDLDPGALVAVLCMNFLTLAPGEAIFIPADGVHCYLSGDVFECMARSDNMLAGGLCPAADRNHADVFCDALCFGDATRPRGIRLPARTIRDPATGLVDHNAARFAPPAGEFDVLRVALVAGREQALRPARGPTVAIVLRGEGTLVGDGREVRLTQGQIFFVAANTAATVRATGDLELYATVGG
ncbi:hexose-6-phosphate isomerase [Beauveria brongniartii RCEF 3172]|uniref:Mannose-6-phosphate isomerase n=1 Tax=Beauveria brongniartii RCEF 3172 TaxID=1081107 RepID=A0A162KGS2_9HYPO|nr:hexose-6-phosphate isomerase [Beauveria brongniartii RCEF 3172]